VLTLTNTTCGLCNGIIIASASAGLAPYTYSWSPSVSTQSFVTGLCPDNYSVTIQDGNKCKSTFSSAIAGSAIFQTSLTASSTEVFQGEPVTLTGMSGVTYTWSPNLYLSCDVCPVTIATPMDDIAYCVEATSVDNCKDTACVDIIVKCGDIFVPNAFSPNNDGHNDELIVFGNCTKDLVFRIYDRWGEMVYESFDTSNKWDGKYKGYSVTAGVFVYQLSAKLKSGEVVNKKGNITVVK
jgi:gliding motility-associated-like protein